MGEAPGDSLRRTHIAPGGFSVRRNRHNTRHNWNMTTTKTLLDIAQLAGVINTGTYTFTTEDELQAGISEHLTAAGIEHTREVRLSDDLGRVDLMVGRVAVEVKIARGWQPLTRQVMRYTRAAEVDGVLVVTTKMAHLQALPNQMGEKPIVGMFLNGAF